MHVLSIIPYAAEVDNALNDTVWLDDDEDVLVDNLVKEILDGFMFNHSHFTGGATEADVNIMREQAKDNINRKSAKNRPKQKLAGQGDVDYASALIKDLISTELRRFGDEIKNLGETFIQSHNHFRNTIQGMLDTHKNDISKMISPLMSGHQDATPSTPPNVTTASRTIPRNCTTDVDPFVVIQDALRFVNEDTFLVRNVSIYI